MITSNIWVFSSLTVQANYTTAYINYMIGRWWRTQEPVDFDI